MRVNGWFPVLTGFLILAIHFPALHFGLYHEGLGVDIVQHLLSGVMGSSATLYLIQKMGWKSAPGLEALTMVGGAAVIALLWELYEYARWELSSHTYVYANSNWDSLSDQACALTTGCLVALVHRLKLTRE